MSTPLTPWTVGTVLPADVEAVADSLTLVVESEESHIAFCFSDRPDHALLLAAAPELLASLREARDIILIDSAGHADVCAAITAPVPCDCWLGRAERLLARLESEDA